MNVLKAKIKISSKNYAMGLNQKKKAVWLQILGFNAKGENNYLLEAVKEFKNNEVIFCKIWVKHKDIQIRAFDDGQLKLKL